MWRQLLRVGIEGTVIFALGVAACFAHYRLSTHSTEFASRWDGSCSGWTRSLVLRNSLGNLGYWWAYAMISTAILRLHPIVDGVRESRPTILLTWAFILTCGGVHLITSYSNLNPIYGFETDYIDLTAPVSLVSVFFIGAGLLRVRTQVEARREKQRLRILELESRQ